MKQLLLLLICLTGVTSSHSACAAALLADPEVNIPEHQDPLILVTPDQKEITVPFNVWSQLQTLCDTVVSCNSTRIEGLDLSKQQIEAVIRFVERKKLSPDGKDLLTQLDFLGYKNNPLLLLQDFYIAWLDANPKDDVLHDQSVSKLLNQMKIALYDEHPLTTIHRVPLPPDQLKKIQNFEHRKHPGTIKEALDKGRQKGLSFNGCHCHLKSTHGIEHLDPKLKGLLLHNNSLRVLPPHVFDNLPALTTLCLSGNKLKKLPDHIFDNLTNLEELAFSDNCFTELPDHVFDKVLKLKTLLFDGNCLQKLPFHVFDKLTELTLLSFSNNDLKVLSPNIFHNLTALHKLWLDGNILTILPDGIFSKQNFEMLSLRQETEPLADSFYEKNRFNLEKIKNRHPEWFKAPLVLPAPH